MKSIKGIFSLVSAGALALAVLPVGAIPIPVPLEPGVSDRITIFRPDGTVYGTVNATEDDEALFGPNKFYTIDSVANGVNPPGPTILREANGISDVFGVVMVGGQAFLAFQSDTETLSPDFVGVATELPEGLPFYVMTQYLQPALILAGWTATFQSDANVPDAGTSIALLGLALTGLGFVRRKLA